MVSPERLQFVVRAIITGLYGAMIAALCMVAVLACFDRSYVPMLVPTTGLVLVMRFMWKGILLWPKN